MPRFVDRVVDARAGGQRRQRLRLGPPREVQAARRPRRRQRRPRRQRRARRRPAGAHPARLPLPPARRAPATASRAQGSNRDGAARRRPGARRCPTAPSCSTTDGRCSPTWSARAPASTPPRAAAAGSATPRWPRRARKAPGFALLGEPGEARDLMLELKTRRRRRPGRVPVGGQVVAGVGASRRPGRRSPTTRSPRWCPNLGVVTRGRARLHRRRRARADPRRVRGPGPRAGLPAAHRAVRGAGARRRLRDARARPRPGLRHRGAGGRARRATPPALGGVTWPTGRGWWC